MLALGAAGCALCIQDGFSKTPTKPVALGAGRLPRNEGVFPFFPSKALLFFQAQYSSYTLNYCVLFASFEENTFLLSNFAIAGKMTFKFFHLTSPKTMTVQKLYFTIIDNPKHYIKLTIIKY